MLGLRSLRSLRPRRENQYWVGELSFELSLRPKRRQDRDFHFMPSGNFDEFITLENEFPNSRSVFRDQLVKGRRLTPTTSQTNAGIECCGQTQITAL
ncbi:hypothetical protein DdX_18611 [Ditylenchus destructor]|uniref:Uncharacterized protein n=1 Tax=Ditylenchus destructor TaxID=166010 RepID=A0AAD4QSR8_9BILA|nr:hypothetical protein DdX_18611 [Ditylenchus destructor]